MEGANSAPAILFDAPSNAATTVAVFDALCQGHRGTR
jgi:hypothetical protein